MNILHTSDWHLGRQFHQASLLDDQRHVLKQIVAYIEAHQVRALLVSGDIYDRSVPPADAVALLDEVVGEVCGRLNTPMILISGNHDSAVRLRFGASQLKASGLHILGDLAKITEPVVISNGAETVHIYGVPYHTPEEVRTQLDLPVRTFDEAHTALVKAILSVAADGVANVCMSHCFVSGAAASDSERPLAIGGADQVAVAPLLPFDYVALGHLHSPQAKGADHVRYSGSLLKYSFSEVGQKKGVELVTLQQGRVANIAHLPLRPLRDMRIIEGSLAEVKAQGALDPAAEDYVLVRLTDPNALLNAMEQVRSVYPNVLHLERVAFNQERPVNLSQSQLKRGPLALFDDFYEQVQGQPLTEAQASAMADLVAELTTQQKDEQ
ncbi:MAG: exonuclease SbcCD subunit D [Neisseriaceae bacterium]|nr:exonuclease SbcCD subunit D [Neisseriaceae bacterium]MBP6863431.1 exonuclease SbcCD subunit D [Neisseriaceae bacterium]